MWSRAGEFIMRYLYQLIAPRPLSPLWLVLSGYLQRDSRQCSLPWTWGRWRTGTSLFWQWGHAVAECKDTIGFFGWNRCSKEQCASVTLIRPEAELAAAPHVVQWIAGGGLPFRITSNNLSVSAMSWSVEELVASWILSLWDFWWFAPMETTVTRSAGHGTPFSTKFSFFFDPYHLIWGYFGMMMAQLVMSAW